MYKRKSFLLATLVCLVPLLAGALLYSRLPESLPTHYNFAGEADGWSNRNTALFVLPGAMVLVQLAMPFLLGADPKRANMSDMVLNLTFWIMPVIQWLIFALTVLPSLGVVLNINMMMTVFLGALFIVMGFFLPKMKPTYTVGIRVPWTLNSEENWNRTHAFAGPVFLIGGLLVLVGGLFGNILLLLPVLIGVVLIPIVYSFLLYRKGI